MISDDGAMTTQWLSSHNSAESLFLRDVAVEVDDRSDRNEVVRHRSLAKAICDFLAKENRRMISFLNPRQGKF